MCPSTLLIYGKCWRDAPNRAGESYDVRYHRNEGSSRNKMHEEVSCAFQVSRGATRAYLHHKDCLLVIVLQTHW